ncbi:MAG: hypothetical protein GX046_01275 [Tissierellia bacterium]|nr:hypothetical protein [Tissierellia bacterium]
MERTIEEVTNMVYHKFKMTRIFMHCSNGNLKTFEAKSSISMVKVFLLKIIKMPLLKSQIRGKNNATFKELSG